MSEKHRSSDCSYIPEVRYTPWGRPLYFLIRFCYCGQYADKSYKADFDFIYEDNDGCEKHHNDDCEYLIQGDYDRPTLKRFCTCDFEGKYAVYPRSTIIQIKQTSTKYQKILSLVEDT